MNLWVPWVILDGCLPRMPRPHHPRRRIPRPIGPAPVLPILSPGLAINVDPVRGVLGEKIMIAAEPSQLRGPPEDGQILDSGI